MSAVGRRSTKEVYSKTIWTRVRIDPDLLTGREETQCQGRSYWAQPEAKIISCDFKFNRKRQNPKTIRALYRPKDHPFLLTMLNTTSGDLFQVDERSIRNVLSHSAEEPALTGVKWLSQIYQEETGGHLSCKTPGWKTLVKSETSNLLDRLQNESDVGRWLGQWVWQVWDRLSKSRLSPIFHKSLSNSELHLSLGRAHTYIPSYQTVLKKFLEREKKKKIAHHNSARCENCPSWVYGCSVRRCAMVRPQGPRDQVISWDLKREIYNSTVLYSPPCSPDSHVAPSFPSLPTGFLDFLKVRNVNKLPTADCIVGLWRLRRRE
ncbi:hypothetical protein RRG08_055670 [Elysia crispata]|uniref:Uncharacterized protein n=1 Tax=Elysia crispata TaxID=231223 RepID=A0AAE1DC41_9GAST|nr:hypothetical protein RRG08_055670 [Elysia crispata]